MEILKPYRQRIDELDDRIIDLLAARMDIVREVGRVKYDNGIPAILPERIDEVLARISERAIKKGFDAGMAEKVYAIIIGSSCDLEEKIGQEISGTTHKISGS